jgi:hypothetical protein
MNPKATELEKRRSLPVGERSVYNVLVRFKSGMT